MIKKIKGTNVFSKRILLFNNIVILFIVNKAFKATAYSSSVENMSSQGFAVDGIVETCFTSKKVLYHRCDKIIRFFNKIGNVV